MFVLKMLGVAFVWGLAGYATGVPLGIGLIKSFSPNVHDKPMEAAMTGAFVVGPLLAVVAAIAGGIWFSQRK